jgi:hypothetical protein
MSANYQKTRRCKPEDSHLPSEPDDSIPHHPVHLDLPSNSFPSGFASKIKIQTRIFLYISAVILWHVCVIMFVYVPLLFRNQADNNSFRTE